MPMSMVDTELQTIDIKGPAYSEKPINGGNIFIFISQTQCLAQNYS